MENVEFILNMIVIIVTYLIINKIGIIASLWNFLRVVIIREMEPWK